VLFLVVVLPESGALLLVVVVVESVDFCVTSGDGAASAPGEVSVVVVVVVSFLVPWHPMIIVPAMKAKAVTAESETILFEILMRPSISEFNDFASVVTIKDSNRVGARASSVAAQHQLFPVTFRIIWRRSVNIIWHV
jgi:hypothetical protein